MSKTLKRRDTARLRVCLAAALLAAATLGGPVRAAEETQYLYDAQGQVILVTKGDGRQTGYSYDSAGNRVIVDGKALVLPTYPDRLLQGQSLLRGRSLVSSNGLYRLTLQDDGNLVMYGQNWAVRWESSTSWGKPGARLTMQSDGNLVVYGPVSTSQVYWSTGTTGGPGSALLLQDDGNLVVYAAGGIPQWSIYQ